MTGTLQITKQKCRGSLLDICAAAPERRRPKRVMGLEPTISCLGSKRSTTELHPRTNYARLYQKLPINPHIWQVLMNSKTKTARAWNLRSLSLQDASTDFLLSRQAMNYTPATMAFYQYTASGFLAWIENQGLTDPQQITARHVRQFLAELIASGRKDTTLHAYGPCYGFGRLKAI